MDGDLDFFFKLAPVLVDGASHGNHCNRFWIHSLAHLAINILKLDAVFFFCVFTNRCDVKQPRVDLD